jgi:TonB system transport protein ExbD (group 1)
MAMRVAPTDDDDFDEMHEINVTPFIDVMLVLLIIFMVAAPLATVDLPVDLPSAQAAPQPRPDKPLFLTVQADHHLAVGDTVVSEGSLSAALDTASNGDRELRVFLRADKTIDYGELMRVMSDLRNAGYLKVALVGLDGGDFK